MLQRFHEVLILAFYILEMPLNVVPVLYYDELVLSQSKTIARFLAKEFGIAGKTNQIQAKADMIIDCITDVEIGTHYFDFYHSALCKNYYRKQFVTC